MKPEMSAFELTDDLAENIESQKYDLVFFVFCQTNKLRGYKTTTRKTLEIFIRERLSNLSGTVGAIIHKNHQYLCNIV
jgi:bisphosphoglycerate-independent phosphoglycerate mutase (AlkP superfamily)